MTSESDWSAEQVTNMKGVSPEEKRAMVLHEKNLDYYYVGENLYRNYVKRIMNLWRTEKLLTLMMRKLNNPSTI